MNITAYLIAILTVALGATGYLLKQSYEAQGQLKAEAAELKKDLAFQREEAIAAFQRNIELTRIETKLRTELAEAQQQRQTRTIYIDREVERDPVAQDWNACPMPDFALCLLNQAGECD